MGLAFWGDGDLEAAHRAYSVCVEGMQRTGHIADILGCSITLADIRSTQGRLSEALRTYEQALRLASNQDGTVLRGTADMHVGMSQIACERNDCLPPPSTCGAPRNWASTPGCRRTRIAGGSRWRRSAKLKEI